MGTPYVLSSDLVSAYPAKSLAIAQYIDGYKLDTGPVQNAQTGTTYTFVLTDTTKTVTANNAAASAYTVPPQASVVWEAYTVLQLLNLGAGVVTITAGAGVTITGTLTVAQYSSATLVRTASNTWTVSGNATPPGMTLVASASLSGSSVLITGCFSAAYDNYQIVTQAVMSASNDLLMRLLVGSAPNTAANYAYHLLRAGVGATVLSAASSGQTSWPLTTDSQSTQPSGVSTIYSPFLAVPTRQIVLGVHAAVQVTTQAQTHTASTSFDGIQFLPGAGTITSGTVKIYGLRNS